MTKTSSDKTLNFEDCAQIATIIVGEEKKQWRVPLNLLCFHSGYFRCALKGDFAESKSKTVKLPKEKAAIFELVVEWLYTHKVGAGLPSDTWEEHNDKIGNLLDAWVLAEYLQIPRLQNTIVRLMSDLLNEGYNIPYKEFNRVCEIVGDDSPLWTWIGECAVWILRDYDDFYQECIENSAMQLLVNVCQKLQAICHISGDECPINESCLVDELDA